jgi:HAE1 family hydrophobic/amphiphilic exporter-1
VGIILGVLIVFILLLGKKIPGGFVPEEDQGYLMVNVILPDAASLERTQVIMGKVEGILAKEEGIEFYTGISGFSMLTSTNSSNCGFFFVSLKEWKERGKETAAKIMSKLNHAFLANMPEATVMAFGPPPIQGLGTAAGFSMMLQDRGGNTP